MTKLQTNLKKDTDLGRLTARVVIYLVSSSLIVGTTYGIIIKGACTSLTNIILWCILLMSFYFYVIFEESANIYLVKFHQWVKGRFDSWVNFFFYLFFVVYILFLILAIFSECCSLICSIVVWLLKHISQILTDIYLNYNITNVELITPVQDVPISNINFFKIDNQRGIVGNYRQGVDAAYRDYKLYKLGGDVFENVGKFLRTSDLLDKLTVISNNIPESQDSVRNFTFIDADDKKSELDSYYEDIKKLKSLDDFYMKNQVAMDVLSDYKDLQNWKVVKQADELVYQKVNFVDKYLSNYAYGKSSKGDPFFEKILDLEEEYIENLQNLQEYNQQGSFLLGQQLGEEVYKDPTLNYDTFFAIGSNMNVQVEFFNGVQPVPHLEYSIDELALKEFIDYRILLLEDVRGLLLKQIVEPKLFWDYNIQMEYQKLQSLLVFQEELYNRMIPFLEKNEELQNSIYGDSLTFSQGTNGHQLDGFIKAYINDIKGEEGVAAYTRLLQNCNPGEVRKVTCPLNAAMSTTAINNYVLAHMMPYEEILDYHPVNTFGAYVTNSRSLVNEAFLHQYKYLETLQLENRGFFFDFSEELNVGNSDIIDRLRKEMVAANAIVNYNESSSAEDEIYVAPTVEEMNNEIKALLRSYRMVPRLYLQQYPQFTDEMRALLDHASWLSETYTTNYSFWEEKKTMSIQDYQEYLALWKEIKKNLNKLPPEIEEALEIIKEFIKTEEFKGGARLAGDLLIYGFFTWAKFMYYLFKASGGSPELTGVVGLFIFKQVIIVGKVGGFLIMGSQYLGPILGWYQSMNSEEVIRESVELVTPLIAPIRELQPLFSILCDNYGSFYVELCGRVIGYTFFVYLLYLCIKFFKRWV